MATCSPNSTYTPKAQQHPLIDHYRRQIEQLEAQNYFLSTRNDEL